MLVFFVGGWVFFHATRYKRETQPGTRGGKWFCCGRMSVYRLLLFLATGLFFCLQDNSSLSILVYHGDTEF